jgi:osmotically-inducible protein OsmY
MRKTISALQLTFAAAIVSATLLCLPQISRAAAPPAGAQAQETDSAASAAASHLDKKQFSNVKVTVDNGVATLTGNVDLFVYKADAAKRVMHAKGVVAVRNQIEVGGPSLSDKELQTKLAEKLEYDRVGYGNVFDAIGVGVDHGVVTLAGHAHNYVNRDSAIALASTMPGVKELVDNIEVDPVSLMDDQSRVAVARAIYSFPTLNKYAINPGMPIRVSVQNGNVELYGTVDSQADKDAAYLRANGVPGVFSVKNYLQVANQTTETSHK